MKGANLQFANLSYARLEEADLRGATLDGADLFNTEFCNADLTGVDFRRVSLGLADFRWANLTNAQLNKTAEYAELEGAIISGCAMNENIDPDEEPDVDFDDTDLFLNA